MAIHHVNKGIAIFSLILGLFVLITCSWTFGSAVYRETRIPLNETESDQSDLDSDNYEDSTPIPSEIQIGQNGTSGNEPLEFWLKFDKMPTVFKGMAMGCAWIAIIGSLFQIVSSIVIAVSSSKNVSHRSKYFVAFHFLTFVILLGTLITPLMYDRQHREFYTMTSFNSRVKAFMQKIQNQDFFHYILSDMHSYYFILSIDCICIFFIMILVSCLLRFDTTEKFDIYDRYR